MEFGKGQLSLITKSGQKDTKASIPGFKPGLHISRKDCKHRLENIVMIVDIDLSQEIFAIDMLRDLQSSLKHPRNHVL